MLHTLLVTDFTGYQRIHNKILKSKNFIYRKNIFFNEWYAFCIHK